jgi:glycosyltransferase involved in cell wall biosynthesis
MSDFGFVVPGRLDQITGGYLYDRRMVEALRCAGRDVVVHEVPGRFPDADATARAGAAALLAGLPDGALLCIDGLALPGFDPALADHAARLRVVVLVHHPLALETGLSAATRDAYAAQEARLLRLCRGVLCPSPASAAALREYGVADERIAIVPPGLDRPLRAPPAPYDGPVRLLSVGTVTPRKGHVLLVEALALVASPSWRLTIVGSLERDAETAAQLRRTIALSGFEGRVTLRGECPPDRLDAAYADADVFVLASFHEGYGMVFAEAMAHGLPILATTGGAIPDTVPGNAGILVPPGNRAALAKALADLINDEKLRERFARGAFIAAASLPDWPQAARNFGVAVDRLGNR